MNRDNPNLRSIDPPDGPDDLAGGLLQGLARPFGQYKAWTFFRTAFWSVLTFGFGPLLALPQRFREFVMMEQEQFWHLAEWVRLNSPHPQAPQLREDAEALRPRYEYQMLAWLAGAFVAVIFFTQLGVGHGISFHYFYHPLLESTWLYPHEPVRHVSPLLARKLYVTWSVGLGVGYLCYWRQVLAHETAVRGFLTRLNQINAADGLPAVRLMIDNQKRSRPIWILGSIAFGFVGAFWGIPMFLGAAAHRAYIARTSVKIRAALAFQLKAMLLHRQPSMNVTMPIYLRYRCNNEVCRAEIPQHAAFCPRCGKRLNPPVQLLV